MPVEKISLEIFIFIWEALLGVLVSNTARTYLRFWYVCCNTGGATSLYYVQVQFIDFCYLHRLALWLQETGQIFP